MNLVTVWGELLYQPDPFNTTVKCIHKYTITGWLLNLSLHCHHVCGWHMYDWNPNVAHVLCHVWPKGNTKLLLNCNRYLEHHPSLSLLFMVKALIKGLSKKRKKWLLRIGCHLEWIINKISQQYRCILGRRKLLVYVRIVVATIFDFMTEEDCGE